MSVLLCGLMGAGLAMGSKSVHMLCVVGSDVLYSMMSPQVTCIFYLSQRGNEYGAISGFVLSILLRTLVGEPSIGLPDVLPLLWDKIHEDGHRQRLFPFRTAIMFVNTPTILLVSRFTVWLSEKGLLNRISDADADADTNTRHMTPVCTDVEEKGRLNGEQSY